MQTSLFRRALRPPLLCLCLLLPAGITRAQYIMEFAQTYNAPMSNFISGTVVNNLGMINAASQQQRRSAPVTQSLRASATAQTARSAQELAQRFPSEHRARMEQLYKESFDIYRKLETKFGWPKDDLAGALAAFVVGNYMVFANTNVADEHFVAVADQFRKNPAMAAAFSALKPADLRTMYEQSAMVGAFMALTEMAHAQKPQPPEVQAKVRDSARANLQQVLGLDPTRLRVGAGGLGVK